MRKSLISLAALAALGAPALAQDMPTATATLQGADGAQHGTVTLHQTPNGVRVAAELTGVPAGAHGFHVHETGACEAPSFESAGGHFAPAESEHGFQVEGGPHAGDMPNVHVPESGTLTVEHFNPRISLLEGEEGYLMDDDGSAIVLHANADDYESQPSGDAGSRIACGVIEAGS
jgi:Cu-Zn family superoxide dismutase